MDSWLFHGSQQGTNYMDLVSLVQANESHILGYLGMHNPAPEHVTSGTRSRLKIQETCPE